MVPESMSARREPAKGTEAQPKTDRAGIVAASITGGAAILLLAVFALYLALSGLYLLCGNVVAGELTPDVETMFLSTLVTMLAILIAGAFIFTSFRIEAQAIHEAKQAVQPAVDSANEAAERGLVAERKVVEVMDEAMEVIDKARKVVDDASKAQLFAEADAFADLGVGQSVPPASDTNGDA